MKLIKYPFIIALTLSLLTSSIVQASSSARYLWNDSKGFVNPDSSCQLKLQSETLFYIAQRPGAELNSYSKLKGTNFLKKLMPGNLLDRSILVATYVPINNTPAYVHVVGVPQNAVKFGNGFNASKRGDQGTLKKESLQEVGNFVIEVLSSLVISHGTPFEMQESYWQAAMDNESYMVLSCGDKENPKHYVLFDVYDSKGIFPVAQVGVNYTENQLFDNVKVLTPDEANQDAIGEAPAETGLPPATNNGDTSVGTPENPSLGYLICTEKKSLPVLDKDLKPIGQVDRFETIIPIQSWDEKQKSTHLEVQFPNRKDLTSGWMPRAALQTQSNCEPYKKSKEGKNKKPLANGSSSAPLEPNVSRKDCCKFPTVQRPTQSYAQGQTRFRASRSKGRRLHAGVDLYRKKGDVAMAVASGRVIRSHYYFYQGVFAVEVKHPQFIARYGEVLGSVPKGIFKGRNVVAGQAIGYIGKVNSGCCSPMLHFELYSGASQGSLTRYRTPPYDRRPDVMDPTPYVRKWEKAQFGKSY